MPPRRPRLALPFTILTDVNTVRLVAGEDMRYTFTAPELETWLPDLLAACRGDRTLDALLERFPASRQAAARDLVQRLYGERILVDGPATAAHRPARHRVSVEGTGSLCQLLTEAAPASDMGTPLVLLCQDRFDWEQALETARRCRREGAPLLWLSWAALTRAYVSPLFLPDAGACLGCLFRVFRRLSPAPEIYDALLEHAQAGGPLTPAEFPEPGLTVLQGLARWKVACAEEEQAPAALYRLHVLEAATLEISSHLLFKDPHCPICG